MKHGYVPLEKRSKRLQREFYAKQRGDWNGIDPVTKAIPNGKAYNRKKPGRRNEYEPSPGFYYVLGNCLIPANISSARRLQ